jgi:DNA primase
MIEHAKNYPMENIIEFDRGWACCLWHDDHKPSAKLLPDNKIRCYVCNENHDAIDAYQKVHGVEFLEAVRKMQ